MKGITIQTVLKKLDEAHGNKKIDVLGHGRIRVSQLRKEVRAGSKLGRSFVNDISQRALRHIQSSSLR